MKHFTIGFGRAGDTPAAKGTGVLIKHGELHGVLTCAQVDKHLRELKQPVGLVRLKSRTCAAVRNLNMDEVLSYAAGEEPWTKGDDDISFIHLPPHLVGNIKKDCIFLDAEKNFSKPEPDDRSSLIQAHCVFGLVEQFTGATTRQNGRATTLLRGVLTSGVLRDFEALTATLECFEGKSSGSPWWHSAFTPSNS